MYTYRLWLSYGLKSSKIHGNYSKAYIIIIIIIVVVIIVSALYCVPIRIQHVAAWDDRDYGD
jgi:hypothetical protein